MKAICLTILVLVSFCGSTIESWAEEPYTIQYSEVVLKGDTIVKCKLPKDTEDNYYSTVVFPSEFAVEGEVKTVRAIGKSIFVNRKQSSRVSIMLNDSVDKIRHIILSDGITNICDSAFEGLNRVNRITLPNTLKTVGTHALIPMFSSYDLEIPASVEHIAPYAFRCNTANNNTLRIAEGIEQIDTCAFGEYRAYKVVLPSTLKRIYYRGLSRTYFGYPQKNTIELPKGLEYIGKEAFEYAFVENLNLSSQSELIIDELAFGGCLYLKKVKIGEGVVSIGKEAFSGHPVKKDDSCGVYRYMSVNMDKATSLRHIGKDAFRDACEGYKFLLPQSKLGKWHSYETTPDEPQEATTDWLNDVGLGYVVLSNAPTKLTQKKKQKPSNEDALYDLLGRRATKSTRGMTISHRHRRLAK